MSLAEKIRGRFKKGKVKKIEIIAALQTTLWGLWLVFPQNTFSKSVTYDYMYQIAPEWVWGYSMFFLGMLQFFGVFFFPSIVKRVISIQNTFAWVCISLSFGFSNFISTAVPQSIVAAIIQIFALDYSMRGDKDI